jgi:hypothetical protein
VSERRARFGRVATDAPPPTDPRFRQSPVGGGERLSSGES